MNTQYQVPQPKIRKPRPVINHHADLQTLWQTITDNWGYTLADLDKIRQREKKKLRAKYPDVKRIDLDVLLIYKQEQL